MAVNTVPPHRSLYGIKKTLPMQYRLIFILFSISLLPLGLAAQSSPDNLPIITEDELKTGNLDRLENMNSHRAVSYAPDTLVLTGGDYPYLRLPLYELEQLCKRSRNRHGQSKEWVVIDLSALAGTLVNKQ
ncbi:hypothetical protein CEQ90_07950 [Lewinellaceae bacterium SD302]|nr:hypothetical protein CEQ90_07950 [Lewinellaceae bacterium SD302]